MLRAKSTQDVKECLTALCELLVALGLGSVTPELLRKGKFNKLANEELVTLTDVSNNFTQCCINDEVTSVVLPALFIEADSSNHVSGRRILLNFGYFVGIQNVLSELVYNKCSSISFTSFFNSAFKRLCSDVDGMHLKLEFENYGPLGHLSSVKNQIKLNNTKCASVINTLNDLENSCSKMELSSCVVDLWWKNFEKSVEMKSRILDLWFSWQKQRPLFIRWLRSVLELEIESMNNSSEDETKLKLLDQNVFPNFRRYLEDRLKQINLTINEGKKPTFTKIPLVQCDDNSLELLTERVNYQKKLNMKKLKLLMSNIDSKFILVNT